MVPVPFLESAITHGPWFFGLEYGIRNQILDAWGVNCYWGVIDCKSSQLTEQINKPGLFPTVYIHIYNISINKKSKTKKNNKKIIFLYVTFNIHVNLNITLYWYLTLIHFHMDHFSINSLSTNSYNSEKYNWKRLFPPFFYLIVQFCIYSMYSSIRITNQYSCRNKLY